MDYRRLKSATQNIFTRTYNIFHSVLRTLLSFVFCCFKQNLTDSRLFNPVTCFGYVILTSLFFASVDSQLSEIFLATAIVGLYTVAVVARLQVCVLYFFNNYSLICSCQETPAIQFKVNLKSKHVIIRCVGDTGRVLRIIPVTDSMHRLSELVSEGEEQ